MGLETATYLSGLVATNPVGATDPKSQGDDHLRLIKAVLLATFPNLNAAVNSTPAELNLLHGLTSVYSGSAVYKAADTDRVTNTVPAADPDLTVSLVPGTYHYELGINAMSVTGTGQGIKGGMAFSGTADIHAGQVNNFPSSLGSIALFYTDPSSAIPIGTFLNGQLDPVNAGKPIKLQALIRVTVTGTLSFNWSQFASNANATRIMKGSYLKVTKIA